MATGLLMLLDDLVNMTSKTAATTLNSTGLALKKTSGIIGDDLALNAQQVTGIDPAREIPVVKAVMNGSLMNKVKILPALLLASALAPALIPVALMLGGLYLCFEGAEKIIHKLAHKKHEEQAGEHAYEVTPQTAAKSPLEIEKEKISGAIRTDLVLSAEIMTIALGTVATASLGNQALVLATLGIVMTYGVYLPVMGIVKADDAGMHLAAREGTDTSDKMLRALGRGILKTMPPFMLTLSVLGTTAMFTVGGEIIAHGIPFLHHAGEAVKAMAAPYGGFAAGLTGMVYGGVVGVLIGLLAVGVLHLLEKTGALAVLGRLFAPVSRAYKSLREKTSFKKKA